MQSFSICAAVFAALLAITIGIGLRRKAQYTKAIEESARKTSELCEEFSSLSDDLASELDDESISTDSWREKFTVMLSELDGSVNEVKPISLGESSLTDEEMEAIDKDGFALRRSGPVQMVAWDLAKLPEESAPTPKGTLFIEDSTGNMLPVSTVQIEWPASRATSDDGEDTISSRWSEGEIQVRMQWEPSDDFRNLLVDLDKKSGDD